MKIYFCLLKRHFKKLISKDNFFESIITKPHEFIDKISDVKGWSIDKSYYDKCIEFIRPRSLSEAFEPLGNKEALSSSHKTTLLREEYRSLKQNI